MIITYISISHAFMKINAVFCNLTFSLLLGSVIGSETKFVYGSLMPRIIVSWFPLFTNMHKFSCND